MIGVISKISQKQTVEEFFQLFKVPWEFYNWRKSYDVIVSTDLKIKVPSARLVILFGFEATPFDLKKGIKVSPYKSGVILEHSNFKFPIYRDLAVLECSGLSYTDSFLRGVDDKSAVAGVVIEGSEQRVVRIGYDLFEEIAFILSRGQPVINSNIPTVEIHISMLRNWILESGLPLVEIPPVPNGHNFIVCLTHDVDFINIRDHKCDRSKLGFILRVLFPFLFRGLRSRLTFYRYLKNFIALLSLPGVYLGIFRDFWDQIGRYMEIEEGIHSTFYFIPKKDDSGDSSNGNKYHKYRSVRYDVKDYKNHIKTLIEKGHEIGVHGLDAWDNLEKARYELEIIRDIIDIDELGIRMHWLYFSENSPKNLGEAGFYYDSSLGFNETIGYRSGTTQVFRFPRTTGLFELPLHMQDTAMFYPNRMALSEPEAYILCKRLIDDFRRYGGVFTVNWHQRSLGPERNWDDFYIDLLKSLKRENVWFATAKQAVRWFEKRRSIKFNNVRNKYNKLDVKLTSNDDSDSPNLTLRVHFPQIMIQGFQYWPWNNKSFRDIPLSGESDIELSIDVSSSV